MNPVETLETAKAVNPLKELLKYGQSVWLDYIRRNLITSGELKRLIEEDGLRGMTSNPVDFRKSDRRQHRLRRFPELAEGHDRPGRQSALRTARHPRHPGRRRHSAPGLRQHPSDATATSAWKFLPTSRTTRKATIDEARRLWKAVEPRRT